MHPGDRVEWIFLGKSGKPIWRRGIIVHVVEQFESAIPVMRELALEYEATVAINRGGTRAHPSYVVLSDDRKLHWPVVSKLKFIHSGGQMPDPI